jgi:hypothetical protein
MPYPSFDFHVRPQDFHSFGPDRPLYGFEVQEESNQPRKKGITQQSKPKERVRRSVSLSQRIC